MDKTTVGKVLWQDLTVENAGRVKDFYTAVVGWQVKPVDMGGYDDFSMQNPQSGQDMAGICHARGMNADLPAQWLLYFAVENLDQSIQQVIEMGGQCLTEVKSFGQSRYRVIQDPAGAVCALFEQN